MVVLDLQSVIWTVFWDLLPLLSLSTCSAFFRWTMKFRSQDRSSRLDFFLKEENENCQVPQGPGKLRESKKLLSPGDFAQTQPVLSSLSTLALIQKANSSRVCMHSGRAPATPGVAHLEHHEPEGTFSDFKSALHPSIRHLVESLLHLGWNS